MSLHANAFFNCLPPFPEIDTPNNAVELSFSQRGPRKTAPDRRACLSGGGRTGECQTEGPFPSRFMSIRAFRKLNAQLARARRVH